MAEDVFGPNAWPVFSSDAEFDQAQQALTEAGLDDGLPLVVPTGARLDAMLEAVRDADAPFGLLPPLFGELTARVVAYQCVLAGCRPAELPLVMAAAVACLEPELNLLGLLTTTGTPAVAVAVHGPAVTQLGINASTNALGPGHRANACTGRAVSLVMRNVAGARDGIADMATMGQPGKFTFCFGEAPFAEWRSYGVRRGLDADANGVTVFGASGTAEVLPVDNGDSADRILAPAALAMAASISSTGARRHVERGIACVQVLLLPPELATTLSRLGLSVESVEAELRARMQAELGTAPEHGPDVHVVVVGGPGVKMTLMPLWAGGSEPVTRAAVPL